MWKTLSVGILVAATAAWGQAPADTAAEKVGPNQDPNQVVCVNEREIGSRLSRRRVCRTRAEWTQIEQQTRGNLDKIQTFKPSCPNGRC